MIVGEPRDQCGGRRPLAAERAALTGFESFTGESRCHGVAEERIGTARLQHCAHPCAGGNHHLRCMTVEASQHHTTSCQAKAEELLALLLPACRAAACSSHACHASHACACRA